MALEKTIEVQSHWGVTTQNDYAIQSKDTLAVILPGGRYTTMAPLLYFAYLAALQAGHDVLSIEYGFQRAGRNITFNPTTCACLADEARETIRKCLAEKEYKKISFIGKSLGTFIQSQLIDVFAAYEQKHVFLTPLPECIDGMKRTDCMAVVGTKDKVFTKEHIGMISNHGNVELYTFEGADHRLEKGDFRESLGILQDVTEHIYHHIKD